MKVGTDLDPFSQGRVVGAPFPSGAHSPDLKLPSAAEKPGTAHEGPRDISSEAPTSLREATLDRQVPRSERVSPKVLTKRPGFLS